MNAIDKTNSCPNCSSENLVKTTEDYNYIECGLDNVILLDLEIYNCMECNNSMPIIPNIIELHKLIVLRLINKVWNLDGKEIKFLRKFFNISATELARILSITKQTVSRWENYHHQPDNSMDRFIKYLFSNFLYEKECKEKEKSYMSSTQHSALNGSFFSRNTQILEPENNFNNYKLSIPVSLLKSEDNESQNYS